jgi:hypothetical protein
MLIDRLIFGCGHLTGGASHGEAARLIRRARAAGIGQFDTAPSYGIGTAEDTIGRLVGRDAAVRITAKVGSTRPAHGQLKSYARFALRAVRGPRHAPDYQPPSSGPQSGCFEPEFMAKSLEASLKALRRPRIDLLLLHEAFAEDLTPSVLNFLEQVRRDGRAGAIGYSNGMPYDATLHAAWGGELIAQTAVDPAALTVASPSAETKVIFHSLIKTAAWLRRTDRRFASGESAFGNALAGVPAAEAILPYALAARRWPDARFIYATSLLARLDSFLRTVEALDDARLCDALAAFDAAYAAASSS